MGKLDHQISMSLDRLQTMLRYEVVVPNLWEANPHFEGAGDSRDERTSSWSFVGEVLLVLRLALSKTAVATN